MIFIMDNLNFDFEKIRKEKLDRSRISVESPTVNIPFPGKCFCSCCQLPVYRKDFIDQLSFDEWVISGFCQNCQNKTFVNEDICVVCKIKIHKEDFISEESIDEWIVSGTCQVCQDKIFGKKYNKQKIKKAVKNESND